MTTAPAVTAPERGNRGPLPGGRAPGAAVVLGRLGCGKPTRRQRYACDGGSPASVSPWPWPRRWRLAAHPRARAASAFTQPCGPWGGSLPPPSQSGRKSSVRDFAVAPSNSTLISLSRYSYVITAPFFVSRNFTSLGSISISWIMTVSFFV